MAYLRQKRLNLLLNFIKDAMRKAKREIVEYKGRYPILVLLLGLAGVFFLSCTLILGAYLLFNWIF